jgi:hypothetical protein
MPKVQDSGFERNRVALGVFSGSNAEAAAL